MNFLAHAFLSDKDEGLIIGNFIADRVKGRAWENYPEPIRKGILLHRFIDDFTDRHEINRHSARLLSPYFGKYSMVVMDVVNDHFLALNWTKFHSGGFEQFVKNTYEVFRKHEALLPEKSRMMLPFMIEQDWLSSYQQLEGIAEVLQRMSRRTRFESGMEKSLEPLTLHFEELHQNFHFFFPELQQATLQFIHSSKP